MEGEQEPGAGMADKQLEEENMKEKYHHSGASKPNSMEGPMPTGIQLQ